MCFIFLENHSGQESYGRKEGKNCTGQMQEGTTYFREKVLHTFGELLRTRIEWVEGRIVWRKAGKVHMFW